MKARHFIFLTSLLVATGSYADNVRVHRIDGGGNTNTSGDGDASSQSGGGGGAGGRTYVRPTGGGGHRGWQERSLSTSAGGRVHVVPRSDAFTPRSHAGIARNTTVVRQIDRDRHVEVVPNRYYWHHADGVRYCHTFRGGVHWYGFYEGPRFYWTRYYGDRWWWFDAGFHRWLFWTDGYWWYPGPDGVEYVYINNVYYPANDAPVDVTPPQPTEPPERSDDTSSATNSHWTSPDGRRMVQSFGPRSEGFLYDATQNPPKYIGYLGSDVSDVRFSGGGDTPLQILVDFHDGSFQLFSPDGHRLNGSAPSSGSPVGPPPSSPPVP